MKELKIVKAVGRIEDAASLDPLVDKVRAAVDALVHPQALRDLLHGVPFGHPLHPVAVLIPLGSWTSAAILDALPGNSRASRVLVASGILSAVPSAVAGFTDWSNLHKQQMRVGLVHSAANILATGLYTASFIQRTRGRHGSGKVLGYLGLALVSGSGFLGGHLSYRQAAGANHTEDIPHRFPEGWQELCWLDELTENTLSSHDVAGVPLLALKRGTSVDVLANSCSHLSGPLNEGTLLEGKLVEGEGEGPCVQCPWHGSVFSLETGEVVHGPATSPQPRFNTRVTNGMVEVLLPGTD